LKRSYKDEVLQKIEAFAGRFDVEQYGALSYDPARYPLFAVSTKDWKSDLPTVLVTGGVHGYETSGVQGALMFLDTQAEAYSKYFNIIVVPCVSPWGYEVINRWNPNADDPNRNFVPNSVAEECASLLRLLATLDSRPGQPLVLHIDLHETTDTDETEFRPAKSARDGEGFEPGTIPDGFYTVVT
jgi:predicted deacylase